MGACLLALLLICGPLRAGEWSGYVEGQLRYFTQRALDGDQNDATLSLAVQPEYYRRWDKGKQSLLFVPFARLDSQDEERSHADIRELIWTYVGDGFETRAGIGKVFWGVTEALHLVDVINQIDLLENPDGEQKLGQPMFKLSLERQWGIVDLYLLPGFRQRTFPGEEGRLRTHPRPIWPATNLNVRSGMLTLPCAGLTTSAIGISVSPTSAAPAASRCSYRHPMTQRSGCLFPITN
jgi:hypothetical protein